MTDTNTPATDTNPDPSTPGLAQRAFLRALTGSEPAGEHPAPQTSETHTDDVRIFLRHLTHLED